MSGDIRDFAKLAVDDLCADHKRLQQMEFRARDKLAQLEQDGSRGEPELESQRLACISVLKWLLACR